MDRVLGTFTPMATPVRQRLRVSRCHGSAVVVIDITSLVQSWLSGRETRHCAEHQQRRRCCVRFQGERRDQPCGASGHHRHLAGPRDQGSARATGVARATKVRKDHRGRKGSRGCRITGCAGEPDLRDRRGPQARQRGLPLNRRELIEPAYRRHDLRHQPLVFRRAGPP